MCVHRDFGAWMIQKVFIGIFTGLPNKNKSLMQRNSQWWWFLLFVCCCFAFGALLIVLKSLYTHGFDLLVQNLLCVKRCFFFWWEFFFMFVWYFTILYIHIKRLFNAIKHRDNNTQRLRYNLKVVAFNTLNWLMDNVISVAN